MRRESLIIALLLTAAFTMGAIVVTVAERIFRDSYLRP